MVGRIGEIQVTIFEKYTSTHPTNPNSNPTHPETMKKTKTTAKTFFGWKAKMLFLIPGSPRCSFLCFVLVYFFFLFVRVFLLVFDVDDDDLSQRGWKGRRLFLIPGSLNVVSCVTNDLNVISCCETQRIQFSRLGPIFLPHHFLPGWNKSLHHPIDFKLSRNPPQK